MTNSVTEIKALKNIMAYFDKMDDFGKGYFLGQTELLAKLKTDMKG